ncbi:hypothetical protein G9008_000717 [Salmonella enterica]|nr:hypothetical protein [Salmonella enterica]
MDQKFFDMQESSRLNMSFNCSGAFNIIYIMRTIIAEGEKQPPSVNQFIQPNTFVRRVLELDNGKLVRTLLTFLVIDTSS